MSVTVLRTNNYNKNEALSFRFQNLAVAPGSPVAGMSYWDTALGQLGIYNGASWDYVGSGGGSVTSFSAGDLSPLFSTSVANATTTPALSFSLSSAAQNTMFAGPASGGIGLPTWRVLVQEDLPSSVPLSYWGAATTDLDVGGFKIVGLSDATSADGAASWGQVQNLFQGVRDYKESVRLASTSNVSVSYAATGGTSGRGRITGAPNTLNGSVLASGDRILLKDQSNGAQNGIWVVTTVGTGADGVWDRATDFDADAEVTSGILVAVTEFTSIDNRGQYVLTTADPIIIGGASGTSLSFTQIVPVGGYIAGDGMSQTGFTFNVVSGNAAIAVSANNIALTLASNSGLSVAGGLNIVPDTVTAGTIGVTSTANGAGIKFNTTTFEDEGSETLALAATVAPIGSGLVLTNDTLNVVVDAATIEIATNTVRVKDSGITFAKIASGIWGTTLDTTGSIINVKGYTFINGASVCRKVTSSQSLGTGAFSVSITHNLNTKDVLSQIRNTADDSFVECEVVATTVNSITISGTNNTGAAINVSVIVSG